MGIAGNSNLEAAQATYEAIFQEFFGSGAPAAAQAITTEVQVSGTSLEIPITTSFPRIQRWLGDKTFKALRAYKQQVEVEEWAVGVELKRLQVDADTSGTVDATLRAFLSDQVDAFEKMIMDELLTNPTGYDGVALLHDSHPHTNSTGDNLTTDALGLSSFRAMDEAMRGFQNEDGKPMNVRPNTLLVGEGNKFKALEITGADRPIYFDNTGAEATSSVIDGITIQNVTSGSHNVVVTPYIDGEQWYLMDLTREGLRPMLTARYRSFEPQTQTGMDSEARFMRDHYRFSLEGDYGVGAGLWWLVGGRNAS